MSVSEKIMDSAREAAILLLAFQDDAPAVLRHLDEEDALRITRYMLSETDVPSDTLDKIAEKYLDLLNLHDMIVSGGVEQARFILSRTYGQDKANEIIDSILQQKSKSNPFDFLAGVDPSKLATVLSGQSAQAAAVILSYITPQTKASQVINMLPPEMKPEIIRRIVRVRTISPEVISQVEESMRKLVDNGKSDMVLQFSGGVRKAVQILQGCDRATEKNVLNYLSEKDPSLAKEIKDNLFVFEDYVKLSDDDMAKVISRLVGAEQRQTLAKALKTTRDDVREKFFSNLSDRVKLAVEEAISQLPPMRVSDVEEAQRQIASIARDLEDEGLIVLLRRGEQVV